MRQCAEELLCCRDSEFEKSSPKIACWFLLTFDIFRKVLQQNLSNVVRILVLKVHSRQRAVDSLWIEVKHLHLRRLIDDKKVSDFFIGVKIGPNENAVLGNLNGPRISAAIFTDGESKDSEHHDSGEKGVIIEVCEEEDCEDDKSCDDVPPRTTRKLIVFFALPTR